MGKEKRLRRQAVIDGREQPHRQNEKTHHLFNPLDKVRLAAREYIASSVHTDLAFGIAPEAAPILHDCGHTLWNPDDFQDIKGWPITMGYSKGQCQGCKKWVDGHFYEMRNPNNMEEARMMPLEYLSPRPLPAAIQAELNDKARALRKETLKSVNPLRVFKGMRRG